MFAFKKIAFVLLGIFFLIFLGMQYKNVPLSNRMIILGVGIDAVEEGYSLTVESATYASSSDSQTGLGSKVITCVGETLGLAVRQVYNESGHTPSLGQCSTIVLGEQTVKEHNVRSILSYFSHSDAFNDVTVIAACKGKAADFLKAQVPFDSSISSALQNTLLTQHKSTGKISVSLLQFTKAQASPTGASILPYIKFKEEKGDQSKNSSQSDQVGGIFDYSEILVFDNGKYVATLEKEETDASVILIEKNVFHSFTINETLKSENFPSISGVGSIECSVDMQPYFIENGVKSNDFSAVASACCNNTQAKPYMDISISMKVQRLKTDDIGTPIDLTDRDKVNVRSDKSIELQNHIRSIVYEAIEAEKRYNCDFLDLYGVFHKKIGLNWQAFTTVNPYWVKDIEYYVFCDVTFD
ncbi:MAG: Ger(x)C family spore germination C-terminal domain-containing protein [Clostridia bacterium]|nr:Ger(x)C family spore germination C-terminal domain-containing protein [Clostridia bacterium]